GISASSIRSDQEYRSVTCGLQRCSPHLFVFSGAKLRCPHTGSLCSGFEDFSSRRCRNFAGWNGRSYTQHQSQINELTLPPTPQASPNLLPNAGIRNKSIVKLAPARVSSAIVSGGPSSFRKRHQAAIVKLHHSG